MKNIDWVNTKYKILACGFLGIAFVMLFMIIKSERDSEISAVKYELIHQKLTYKHLSGTYDDDMMDYLKEAIKDGEISYIEFYHIEDMERTKSSKSEKSRLQKNRKQVQDDLNNEG